jgi:hypothetical protein
LRAISLRCDINQRSILNTACLMWQGYASLSDIRARILWAKRARSNGGASVFPVQAGGGNYRAIGGRIEPPNASDTILCGAGSCAMRQALRFV